MRFRPLVALFGSFGLLALASCSAAPQPTPTPTPSVTPDIALTVLYSFEYGQYDGATLVSSIAAAVHARSCGAYLLNPIDAGSTSSSYEVFLDVPGDHSAIARDVIQRLIPSAKITPYGGPVVNTRQGVLRPGLPQTIPCT